MMRILVEGRSYSHTVAYDFRMLKHCTVQCLNVRKLYLLRPSDVESQDIHIRVLDVQTQHFSELIILVINQRSQC